MTEIGQVASLYRYPVKGMSPQHLDSVEVRAHETFPFDRAYAIENGPGRFDPEAPRHLPKVNFLMLMRDEKLATLRADFDEGDDTLTLHRDGKQVVRGQLSTRLGRSMIEQFLGAYMEKSLRGAPKIVSASGHSFSDVADKCVHIVNLASVAELERVVGGEVDPLRFRANIYLAGMKPWQEFQLIDKPIRIGNVNLEPWHRTVRCDATNVDPATGARDMAIPNTLLRVFGHSDFGIYARIKNNGKLSTNDPVVLLDPTTID